MSKHTPGPWNFSYGRVYTSDGIPIVSPDRNTPDTSPAERDANGRLAAAAPDLLKALEGCAAFLENESRREMDRDGEVSGWVSGNLEAARLAIKKAGGTS